MIGPVPNVFSRDFSNGFLFFKVFFIFDEMNLALTTLVLSSLLRCDHYIQRKLNTINAYFLNFSFFDINFCIFYAEHFLYFCFVQVVFLPVL